MTVDEQQIMAVFDQLASKDPLMMEQIARHEDFAIEADRCLFTLPLLFEFLQYLHPGLAKSSYRDFRRIIFNCPINRAISVHNAEIVIIDNQHKVDQSTYALVWRQN